MALRDHSLTRCEAEAAPGAKRWLGLLAWVVLSTMVRGATLEEDFTKVRPILQEYCLNCHSTEKQKGDLDLEVFASVEAIRRRPKIWQGVVEQLETHEMPPKAKPQPPLDQRAHLLQWTGALLESVAREHAGDPGPVGLRRLSNAEYTYTVRDLTGVETLEPAREFPVDGAAGEGFTNTGLGLVMSPAMLGKYLAAGKEIASHAVLGPQGISFSVGNNRREWAEELLGKLRVFYQRYTTTGEAQSVVQQGIKMEVAAAGRLPVERYLSALSSERAALGSGRLTVEALAQREGLSAKYLATLWALLTGHREATPLLASLRARWQGAVGDPHALTVEIGAWQKALWQFNKVGHLGKPGGPKAWMEPVSPLVARQEFRIKVPAPADGKPVSLFLVASPVFAAGSEDTVVWEKPRVVVKGKPDVFLRDLNPDLFDHRPVGEALEDSSVVAASNSTLEVRLPPSMAGGELVVTGRLRGGVEDDAAQLRILPAAPGVEAAALDPAQPILAGEGSTARRWLEESFAAFRTLFPAALCYEKIIPSDEVVTLNHYYREDGELTRLMLPPGDQAELDRLWDELRFVSQDALTQVDALSQLIEYATQDGDPKPFRAMQEGYAARAALYRQQVAEAEPRQWQAVLDFAERAYRRPLAEQDHVELRRLYQRLRGEDLPHEEAIRLLLAKVLVTPAFLYRGEEPAPGAHPAPVSTWELASRLSYFLWSSQPDAQLRAEAESGQLRDPAVLRVQTRRMLAQPPIRRLALEFGCQWLHLRDFEGLDEKSERAFPTFAGLRSVMLEETVRTFMDLWQNDGSILELLESDHGYLNQALAQHYGIPGVTGSAWRKVDGVRKYGRGGLLGQAAVLSRQAGASRSSPILRGDFIVETLLGEKIPRPPKDVPPFPETTGAETLTVRQITERHTADERCAGCHQRMDPYGFALENFDGVGRWRQQEEGGRAIESGARLADGTELAGVAALRQYLAGPRREAFVRQFCRKLLGFALGRGVQLSDEPLLAEIRTQLAAHEYRVSTAVECIVLSPQFQDIRGREMPAED